MVQIAAVSHVEDAQVLVDALHKKGYTVTAQRKPEDGLIHVDVYKRQVLALVVVVPGGLVQARAQSDAESGVPAAGRGRILLVLPFDNRRGSLAWSGFGRLRRRF